MLFLVFSMKLYRYFRNFLKEELLTFIKTGTSPSWMRKKISTRKWKERKQQLEAHCEKSYHIEYERLHKFLKLHETYANEYDNYIRLRVLPVLERVCDYCGRLHTETHERQKTIRKAYREKQSKLSSEFDEDDAFSRACEEIIKEESIFVETCLQRERVKNCSHFSSYFEKELSGIVPALKQMEMVRIPASFPKRFHDLVETTRVVSDNRCLSVIRNCIAS